MQATEQIGETENDTKVDKNNGQGPSEEIDFFQEFEIIKKEQEQAQNAVEKAQTTDQAKLKPNIDKKIQKEGQINKLGEAEHLNIV